MANVRPVLALVLTLAACDSSAPDPPRASIVIANVTVVDVRSGRLLPARDIFIDGDSIVAVFEQGTRRPAGARVIDGTGRYAIPGLWDMHVHTLWQDSIPEQLLPRFVAAGVTGVRDMGGTAEGIADARRLQASGSPVPRVVAAGPVLDGPEPVDPSISFAVADSAGAVAAVDSLQRLGADFVKVYTLLPADAFRAAARRARELGMPIAGHVPSDFTVEEGARAGMRSVEHLREEIELFCTRSDSVACDRTLAVLRDAGVWQTPTLVALEGKTRMRDPAFANPAGSASMPPAVVSMWSELRASRMDRDSAYWSMRADRWRDALWLTHRLRAAGVHILAGSDTPVLFTYPGESLHRELELLVEAGLAPIDALRAATLEPAAYLDAADRFGAIEAGYAADLVLLNADPLSDIRATRAIEGVLLRGRWLDRAGLDALAD